MDKTSYLKSGAQGHETNRSRSSHRIASIQFVTHCPPIRFEIFK